MPSETGTALPKEGRLLAIDFGDGHTGFALSDPLQITAQNYASYAVKGDRQGLLAHIGQLVREKNIVGIVLGMPVNMNGSEGEMVRRVRQFAEQLRTQVQLPIAFIDERLTSRQAMRTLNELGTRRSKKKDAVHSMAATLMLRAYLDGNR